MFVVGDTPTSHVKGCAPCNPFLAFANERPSPVIEPYRCDTAPIRSRHP